MRPGAIYPVSLPGTRYQRPTRCSKRTRGCEFDFENWIKPGTPRAYSKHQEKINVKPRNCRVATLWWNGGKIYEKAISITSLAWTWMWMYDELWTMKCVDTSWRYLSHWSDDCFVFWHTWWIGVWHVNAGVLTQMYMWCSCLQSDDEISNLFWNHQLVCWLFRWATES